MPNENNREDRYTSQPTGGLLESNQIASEVAYDHRSYTKQTLFYFEDGYTAIRHILRTIEASQVNEYRPTAALIFVRSDSHCFTSERRTRD